MDDPDEVFSLTRTAHADTQVIHVKGTLDFVHASLMRHEVDALLEAPHTATLIIDLSEVSWCDSSGLTELVHARQGSQAAAVRLMLAGVQGGVQRRLAITGLAAVFDSYPSLHDALNQAPRS